MPDGGQNVPMNEQTAGMSEPRPAPEGNGPTQGRQRDPIAIVIPTENDSTPRILALAVTVGFFGLLFLLCFKAAPDANNSVLNIILGSLGTAWVSCMAYYFGGNQAGRAKDRMLFQSRPVASSDAQ